jgi:hypothetical protein
MAQVVLSTDSVDDYRTFLAIKQLPTWSINGHVATFPDEYAERIGLATDGDSSVDWDPSSFLFDYQAAISRVAIQKRKYAVFADCGLGKTLIMLEFAQAAHRDMRDRNRGFLIVSPLMVIPQTIEESSRWYPDVEIEQVSAANMQSWLDGCGGKIGITNYESFTQELRPGQLGGMALDESSMLKSHYGKWATRIVEIGRGLAWKSCYTGTPAPNDRIEYANHAVFLDQSPTVNSFLATYFVNKGQTSERWVLKRHALRAFYQALSHWSIFLTKPSTYGWRDNGDTIPPIETHVHTVPLTDEQVRLYRHSTGNLFARNAGGISERSALSQLAKGKHKGRDVATNKPRFIRELCDGWDGETTLIWCRFNAEQDNLAAMFGDDAASISGSTPHAKRIEIIDGVTAGDVKTLISKPKILGFGLNLQIATRQVFSTLQDSYEEYYQAVKRSNRIGSTRPLNVHIPLTEFEEPMAQNVLRKAALVQQDTEEQERIFQQCRY